MAEHVDTDRGGVGLVEDREHGDHVAVLGLADELGEGADVVERALGVRDAHDAVEEVDRAQLRRVVVPVLAAGHRVQVEVDSEAVLARPGDRLEEVRPTYVREEGLVRVDLDQPVRDRDPNPVEPGGSDLGKILLGLRPFRVSVLERRLTSGRTHNERLVVLRDDGGHVAAEDLAEMPLVDRVVREVRAVDGRVEWLEERGRDERLNREPAAVGAFVSCDSRHGRLKTHPPRLTPQIRCVSKFPEQRARVNSWFRKTRASRALTLLA